MLSAVILSLLASVVASSSLELHFVRGSNGILKPNNWVNDVYPAANQTASPTQFLTATYWHSTSACSGPVDIVTGTGFDICYTDGAQSYINLSPYSEQNGLISFSSSVYSSKDCTGSKYGTFSYNEKSTCGLSEGNTGRKYMYTVVKSTTPWAAFKVSGVVTKGYYAPESCTSTASAAVFTLTTASNCVTTGGAYPNYTYEKWTACANGYITKSAYSGTLYCDDAKFTGATQAKLTTCVPNSKKYDTETQMCYNV